MKAGKSSGSAPSLQDRLAEWAGLLDGCGRKPTRKRVHALRVMTLRLQAELERDAADLPSASHQVQTILRFSKQSARLRQALGRVRELDVWISKLRGLRASLTETMHYVPRSMRDCTRQIERLETRLKDNRRSCERKLVAEIERRHAQLESAAEEAGAAVEERTGSTDPHAFEVVFGRFAEIATEFSSLNEENLHDFRRRIKTVRYLAEISQGDAACARLAAQMQKLQSAIGEWHDWQVLAHKVSAKPGGKEYLAELLQNIAQESFEAALETCQSAIARLLATNPASNGEAGRRKPVANVEAPTLRSRPRLA